MRCVPTNMYERIRKCRLWLLVCLPILFISCIKDEEVVLDDYCYISSVSLGNVKRVVKSGDSNVYSSYTASYYRMTIDQRKQSIENHDSLLYGSNMNAVLLNISYSGSYLAYRKITPDNDGVWQAYSPTDSIDLTSPIELHLLSNDSRSSRVYTLKVNVHQQEGDSLYWTKVDELEAGTGFEAMTETRAAIVDGNNLVVLGRAGGDIRLGKRVVHSDEAQWEFVDTDLPTDADLQTLAKGKGKLYVSTAEGAFYESSNAETWTRIGTGVPGMKLAAVTKDYFYALAGGKMYSSQGATDWTREERLDEKSDSLPTDVIGTLDFIQPNGNNRLVMVGHHTDDAVSKTMVWNKMWNSGLAEGEAEWTFVNWTRDNKNLLPVMEHTCLMKYDGKCLAFGRGSDKMYFSSDYGITWRTDSGLHLPLELEQVPGNLTSAVGDDNVIWIIAGNSVWKGRLNRLGFARP